MRREERGTMCAHCDKHMELMWLDSPHGGMRAGGYWVCHGCQSVFPKCEIWSRVSGYLRPKDGYNPGKQEEFDSRVTYEPKELNDGRTSQATDEGTVQP